MRVAPLRQRQASSHSPPASLGRTPREEETQPLVAIEYPSGAGKNYKKQSKLGRSAAKEEHVNSPVGDQLPSRRLLPSLYVVLALSFACHLAGLSELAEDVIIAAVRTLVQLSCLGAILSPLFRSTSPLPALAYALCFMLPLAAYEATARSSLTYRGATRNILAGLGSAVILTAAVALFGVLRPTPRLSARHLIPLAGMLLSNSLSGAALALDRILDELKGSGSSRLEVMLAFGATPSEASYPAFAGAIASAMVPTLNAMNVIGLVAIPGMMTGQILGGSSPMKAARYQIMIMFLIAGAAGMTSGITCWLTVRDAFNSRGMFLAERIVEQRSARVSKLLAAGPGGMVSWFGGSSPEVVSSALHEDDAMATTVVLRQEDAISSSNALVAESKTNGPLFFMDLHGTIRGGTQPFHASLSLPPNSVTAILGTSGIGKSTLLKLMAELSGGGELGGYGPRSQKTWTSSSSLQLHGKERSSYPPHEWRRRVLYVPQAVASGLPGTPRELLTDVMTLRAHARRDGAGGSAATSGGDAFAMAEDLLSEWGLPSLPTPSSSNNGSGTATLSPLDRPWNSASGGEGQRILLALALSTQPDVLLLDEPTSALDDESKRLVEGSLSRLAGKHVDADNTSGWNCAVVMVTHDEEQARRVAGLGAGTSRGRYRLVEEKQGEAP